MAKSVYISSIEPGAGKSLASLGVMELAARRVARVGFFRPIISSDQLPDREIDLMSTRYGIVDRTEHLFAFSHKEARKLVESGRMEELLQRILGCYSELAARCDFVVCEGTDYTGVTAAFEFDFNARVAGHLGCPVLFVASGSGKEPALVFESVGLARRAFVRAGCSIVAIVINRVHPGEVEAVRRHFHTDWQHEEPVYVVPEDKLLSKVVATDLEDSKITARSERNIASALGLFEEHVDLAELEERVRLTRSERVTPLRFEYELIERAKASRRHIVLPEGDDERILQAADLLLRRGVADLTLLGDPVEIREREKALDIDLEQANIVDPLTSEWRQEFVKTFHELRRHKGVTEDIANDVVSDVSYFGTLMVHSGYADGMVSGAVHTTADTIRPALQIIKARQGLSVVSSVFLMCLEDRVVVYGDCAINPRPDPGQLADIALSSAGTAAIFGIEPRVALLSYSTGESGSGEDVEKVREAVRIAKEQQPDLPLDGPIQYDAAVDASVAGQKLPGSDVAGRATIFVFPDLNTGNNTYKAVQRSSGAVAIGPILQGLRKPVNDLSRGCTITDIVNTVAVTAIQAQRGDSFV